MLHYKAVYDVISDLMVSLFLSLFNVFKALFSFTLNWMLLNSLLCDSNSIYTYSHFYLHTIALYSIQKPINKNFFFRNPTRSDRFSVPVTLLKSFMVSKAIQYLAINFPVSASINNKCLKAFFLRQHRINKKRHWLYQQTFKVILFYRWVWCWCLHPCQSAQWKTES